MKYVITNGEGSYIHKDSTSGKYVPIRSFKKATQWDSIIKANGILHNSISKNIRDSYAVQIIDTYKTAEDKVANTQNDIYCRNTTDDDLDQLLSKINTIVDVVSSSDARQQELNGKLSNVDKEIVDIEHYIEFGNFNAYQGWMCFKMLQNLLKQRRRCKNEMQVLNLIKQCRFDKNSLIALSQTLSNIQNKCYVPRALPELFNK